MWGWLLVGISSLCLFWLILTAFRKAIEAYRHLLSHRLEHEKLLQDLKNKKAEWAAVSSRTLYTGKPTDPIGYPSAGISVPDVLLPLVLKELRKQLLALDDALQASGFPNQPDPASMFEMLQSVERLVQVPDGGVSSTDALARLQAFARCFGYPVPTDLPMASAGQKEYLTGLEWKRMVTDWCRTQHLLGVSIHSSL